MLSHGQYKLASQAFTVFRSPEQRLASLLVKLVCSPSLAVKVGLRFGLSTPAAVADELTKMLDPSAQSAFASAFWNAQHVYIQHADYVVPFEHIHMLYGKMGIMEPTAGEWHASEPAMRAAAEALPNLCTLATAL